MTDTDWADPMRDFVALEDFDPTPKPGQSDPDAAFQLAVRTAHEICSIPDPPESDQLLGLLVTRAARTIIVGDTGHGKTSLALRMLAAILTGETMLGWQGATTGPVLVVDLEQGLRSIKRGLRDAHLDDRDDVLYISVPDGLALDRNIDHLAALDNVLAHHKPAVLLLDPYYKAHRADDPNAERAIVDLMRQLDRLRAEHGFALILPAHPRKDQPGRDSGARKLTIHDISGSGAVTRGAEIVLGLERLGHGYARLRYLKDREGDLPVGDAVTLIYDKEEGFKLDPRDQGSDETLAEEILSHRFTWATVNEIRDLVGKRQGRVRTILEALVETRPDAIRYAVGPAGRRPQAHCYSTDPADWDQSGSADQLWPASETDPTYQTSPIGEGRWGTVSGAAAETDPIRDQSDEFEDLF